jgi:hypothetical protein
MTPTATATAPDLNLHALRADAEVRLVQLREQRGRLSPEALTDPDVAQELEDVESQIAATEAELARIGRAGTEAERRAVQERTESETARRESHLAEARRLQGEREQAARLCDETAAAYAAALRGHFDVCGRQDQALNLAGERVAPSPPWGPTVGLIHALRAAGTPPGMIELASMRAKVGPLAESDPKRVEPPEV